MSNETSYEHQIGVKNAFCAPLNRSTLPPRGKGGGERDTHTHEHALHMMVTVIDHGLPSPFSSSSPSAAVSVSERLC